MISKSGIEANPDKISAVMNMPPPKSVEEVHLVVVSTNHPLKQVLSSSELSGTMVKWAVELSEFSVEFHPRPVIKAQVLADFTVELAYNATSISTLSWSMHINRSSTSAGSRDGIVLESPKGDEFDDSQLVVNYIQGSFETRDEKIAKYSLKAKNLFEKFEEAFVVQVLRTDNAVADQLAKLTSSMTAIRSRRITFLSSQRAVIQEQEEIMCVDPTPPSWKEEIVRFLTDGTILEDQKEANALKGKASRFIMIDGDIYKRDFSLPLLKCLTPEEENYVLREIHEGICENQLGRKALAGKALRHGFFWPTMLSDAHELVGDAGHAKNTQTLITSRQR
ncbi:UNVERIFIED_CONTAM: hypothetical protein Sindi_2542700 [Sesamum indicum]